MKAIEERARNFSIRKVGSEFGHGAKYFEEMYVEIATEQRKIDEEEFHPIMEENVLKAINKQRKIDIEKACKWLAENADDYSRSSLTDISRYLWVDPHLIADFRKAMED